MIYIILLILILISLFKNKIFFKIERSSYFNLIIYFDNYIIKFYDTFKNVIIFNKEYG